MRPRSLFFAPSLRTALNVSVILALMLTVLAVPTTQAAAFNSDTYADSFGFGFGFNSGTAAWETDWIESGEADGFLDGAIVVGWEVQCPGGGADPCLIIGKGGPAEAAVERELDLGWATSVTLEFDVNRHKHGSGTHGTVELSVSDDGGTGWTVLQTWDLAINPGVEPEIFDISEYASSNTRIRFEQFSGESDSHINIDNVTITADDAWYLKGDGVGKARLGSFPTQTSLPNYDPSHDAEAGRFLQRSSIGLGETDIDKHQWWISPARGQDLDGPIALSIWSATKDFATGIRGVVDAGLYDCLPDGSDCNLITTSQLDLADWSGGTTDWVERQIDFGSVTHPIASTRSLAIKLVVNNISGDDMWFAYDTVAYPSRLNVTLYVPVTNLAPVFGQDLADRSTPEGTAVSISAAAADPDLDTLAYSATGLPSGVSIDPATGLISGTIDFTASGTYSTAITVTDDGSPVLSAVDAFTWTVTEVNRPPIFIEDLVDRSEPRGTLISFKLDALDPDASDTLTYSATGLPQGLTIDSATGWVSGAIGPNASGTTAVTITVTDDGSPPMTDIDTFAWTLTTGENTYLIANTGGANGGDDLLTAVDLNDPNPVSNEMSIGTGTGTTNIEAADIQPGSNVLFAVQKNRIGTIDVTSGVFTPRPVDAGIGNGATGLRAFDNIQGLAFHPFTSDLFGTHRRGGLQPDLLFRIDPVTGSHIPGAFGGADYVAIQVQGIYYHSAELAFDPTDGQLYMVHTDLAGNWSIATLDTATGATSTVGASPNDLVSLAFDESGRMFGATATGGAETIIELSKTDASVLNSIVIDNGSNYESMVISYSADPNMGPTFNQDLTDRTDPEGSPISMAAGASDPDTGDVLTYSATGLPPGLAIDPSDGTISGTVSFSASGTYATHIEVTDNGIPNLNAIDTFTWTIAEINRNPGFNADLGDQTDAEGSTIALSAGATDPDPSDDLLYTASGLPNGLTIDPATGLISGTIDFDAASTSPYLVSVMVIDDGAPPMAAAPDTFTWLVTNTNRPPVMVDTGAHTTAELVPFSLTVSAADPDGTTPSFTDGGSLPAWATLTDNLNGTATISGTPGVGGSGTTTVTLVASDGGLPNLSDSTTFDLTVTNTNVAPTITNPGNQTTPEAAPYSLTLFGNDIDGTKVSFSDAGTLPSWASITNNGDNTATIIGTPGYSDQGTTSVTITVSDGLLTNDAVFDITVTNTNQPPSINPITDQSVAENDPFTLLISGSDPDGTTVSFTDSGTLPPWATLIDNANNTATISGNPGFADEGTSAVTITVSDGGLPNLSATTSFNLIVDNTNRPPTITPVLDQSIAENSAFSVTVSSADPDGTFPSMAAVGLPSWATWLDNGDGTATLSGTPGFADQATSTVTVTVADGGVPNLSATTSFDLTVTNVNQPPTVAFVLDQAVAENSAFTLTIGASDPDGTIVSFTDSGTLPLWATLLDNGDNSATITGTPGFTDEAITSVTITVADGDTPNLSATTDFDIAVFNTNQPPIADPIADQFTAEAIALNLIVTASDPDGTTVSFTDSGSLPAWATLTDNGNNTATINGTPGYSDDGVTSVSITVEDGGVPDLSATATFDLSVVNTNRPPAADLVPNQFGAEAAFFSTTITASDPDGTIVSFTDSGTLPPWATLLDNGDNTATIAGTPTYSDAATTGVTITVSDGGAPNYTATTSFDITVANTNQPPTVGPIVDQTAAENAPFSLVISGADADGTTVTLTDSGTLPGWASLLDNGDNTATITGTPGFGDEGVTSATIMASDGTLTGTASFDITVTNTNRSPTLDPIAGQSVAEGEAMSLVVAGSDPDGTTLTFGATLPTWASLTDNGDNTATISGSPGFNDEATTTVTIMVEDGGSPNLSASTTFDLTVTNTNRAPTMGVVADQLIAENDPFTMTITASDPDATIVAIADSGTLPPWAAMTDNGDGTATISGTPGLDDVGTTLVTITGSDGDLSSSTTFELTVAGTNRPPILDPIGYQAADELSLVSFIATASDPDGDGYTFSLSNPSALPPGVAITAGGHFTWIPGETDGPGTYLVTVVVTDDASPSLTDSQEVTIVVAETNQLPTIAAMQPFSADTGTTFTHAVVVTDPDQPASNHTFWLQDAPAGVTINPGTGVISWTPAIDQGPASHTFTVGVTDAGTPTFTATQTITVNVALAAPIPADTTPPNTTPPNTVPPNEVPEEIVEPVVEPPIEFPSEPTVTSPPSGQPPQATPEQAASQERRQNLMTAVAQPTPEVEHQERAVVERTLVLMARASFTTLTSLGPPLWLLLGMFGFIAIFGRITVGPWFGAGRRRQTGKVGWFDRDRGYGFIVDDDSEKQVFVHASHVRGRELGIGDSVSFRAIAGERRSFARAVRHRGDDQ